MFTTYGDLLKPAAIGSMRLKNGICMAPMDYRIEYPRAHIEQVREAVADGVEVLGCSMWGAIDLVANMTLSIETLRKRASAGISM
ncbi:hypothetical protein B5F74_09185 [Collinsella sp. An271]|uniref:family 1 glycosylhydrolase n=1 Tax=Collinsella sp. An271 TaxID=1965616 RepID=UPI000B39D20D|nr:family 1 glycosylhydrolase [Collinsella sp. An271]OUO58954.1 hypothetical protein B5F74_09185 [Collinsella sp. An271]